MVVAEDYPYLTVQLSIRGRNYQLRAYLDTGFDGYLTPPEDFQQQLGPPEFRNQWAMADGSETWSGGYVGIIEIPATAIRIAGYVYLVGDEPLLGRGIIDQLRITFDHGQRLIVEP